MMWIATIVVVTGLSTLICLHEGMRHSLLNEMDEVLLDNVNENDTVACLSEHESGM